MFSCLQSLRDHPCDQFKFSFVEPVAKRSTCPVLEGVPDLVSCNSFHKDSSYISGKICTEIHGQVPQLPSYVIKRVRLLVPLFFWAMFFCFHWFHRLVRAVWIRHIIGRLVVM